MPIYEYVCRNCGHELEQLQRLSDDPLSDCPQCAEPQLKRKISAAGFRLAGGGWYETDFKSDGKRNLAGSGEKSGGDGDSKKAGAGDKSDKSSSKDGATAKPEKSKDSKSAKTQSANEPKKKASGSKD